MRLKRLSLIVLVTLLMGLVVALTLHAAPADLEPDGVVVPLGERQATLRLAYRDALAHLYDGGRLHWLATPDPVTGTAILPGQALPGDFYLPSGEGEREAYPYTAYPLQGTLPLSRAYALTPGKIAVMRSTVTVPVAVDDGYVMAMWELPEIRQVLDGYLMGAIPYDVLTEAQIAAGLADYDLLIIPAFRIENRDEILARLAETGALDAMAAFVANGGTLYAQGSGLEIAEAAGLLPEGAIDLEHPLRLLGEGGATHAGRLNILQPDSPLAYSWLDNDLYVLDDPYIAAVEGIEVIAELTNVDTGEGVGSAPAIFRYPAPEGAGEVIGVVGHPTDGLRRHQIPIFMDALLTALAGPVDFYGDAIQTFNPAYPPHQFPAYEVVPVSATLIVDNLWDQPIADVIVTETVAAGYTVLSDTVHPAYTNLFTAPRGSSDPRPQTIIVWHLGDLAPNAERTLRFQAESDPQTLAAGVGTFGTGMVAYTDLTGERLTAQHRPFVLTARMAARLVGDRDLEADRHFNIPADGVYLDLTLSLENKEETPAYDVRLRDWAYLLAPIVDYADQRVILSTNDGETIWMRNEPYLWNGDYPPFAQADAATDTLTLADWRALPEAERPRCVFTSPFGIHIDLPADLRALTEDFGSFITIPAGYEDAITVTADNELLLPCLPLDWELPDFHGYMYREPAVRFGVHSYELFGREVRFHGAPREGVVVLPYDAGSVYVMAGTDTVPFREHLKTATPYHAAPPDLPTLTWQDVWSRTQTMTLRATFYDVWDWDSCATCERPMEQHAGFAVTFGIYADLDGDGEHETLVREIPTRLDDAQLQLLGKTYSQGGSNLTIPEDENLIQLPIFHGLGVKIGPAGATWYDSWRSVGPGASELFTVTEGVAYDDLFFRQVIPPGSWASFIVSATIENYPFNREGQFKIHDGGRLIYRQQIAGPNRYEVYDAHVHVPEGVSSDGQIAKQAGPTAVSIYNDTLFFFYDVWDEADARPYYDPADPHRYDPYIKSWGYGDAVWTTYAGGSEKKMLFHTLLGPGDPTRVRVSFDNNTGVTVTNLSVALDAPAGITVTHLYTDPTAATTPEPIWPELAFLNRSTVPDAWRSVWYFDLVVSEELPAELWGQVVEIPVTVTADNLPADYDAPPVRLGFKRADDPMPMYTSGPAHSLVLTDALPSEVTVDAIAWLTDTATRDALEAALDHDAGDPEADTASDIFADLTARIPFTQEAGALTVDLPEAMRQLPPEGGRLSLVAKAELARAHHGPNIVNEGAGIAYTDPFGLRWTARSEGAIVEAHGAALWVEYECGGGWGESQLEGARDVIASEGGECSIPSYGPAEVVIHVTAYNAGDAIARESQAALDIPWGVEPSWADPMWDEFIEGEGRQLMWELGDMAPGQWKEFTIVLWIDPAGGEWEGESRPFEAAASAAPTAGRLVGIRHTDGDFFDDYSQQQISAQIGGPLLLNVHRAPQFAYLPVILRNYRAPISIPYRVGTPVPKRDVAYQGEVFYRTTFALPADLPTEGRYYLSSSPDDVAMIMVDDALALVDANGEDAFYYLFSKDGDPPTPPEPATVEIPAATMASLAGQTVTLEYRDVFASVVEATEVWLIYAP